MMNLSHFYLLHLGSFTILTLVIYTRNQFQDQEKDVTVVKSFLILVSVRHDVGLPSSVSCFTQIIISQLLEQYLVHLKIPREWITIITILYNNNNTTFKILSNIV